VVNWKTGLVVLAARAARGGSAYPARQQPVTTPGAKSLVPCNQFQTVHLDLEGGGKSLVLDRPGTGNTWRLEKPVQADADTTQVHTLLGRVSALAPDSSIDNAEPARYGLTAPSRTLTCRVSDGSSYTLSIGDESFDGSGYYASTGGGRVYVVSGLTVDQLDQALANPPVRPSPGAPSPGPSA